MRSIEIKAAVIMALLFMILMRLVWMDMRSYVIVYAPENNRIVVDGGICQKQVWQKLLPSKEGRPSWGDSFFYRGMLKQSCRGGIFSEGSFVRYNQGFLLVTVIMCMVFSRIITRSWVIALLVGLALLSRGRLIASSGQISGDHMIMLGLSIWAMFMAHWIRSGSRLILSALYTANLCLIDLELSFALLAFVPFLYAIVARSRYTDRFFIKHSESELFWPKIQSFLELENFFLASSKQSTGGIFRPLPQTFAGPLRQGKVFERFRRDFLWGAGLLITATAALAYYRSPGPLYWGWNLAKLNLWWQLWVLPIDRDLLLSWAAVLLSIAVSSLMLPALRGFNLVLVLGLILSTMGTLALDHIFLPAEATGFWLSPQIILWWEPLFLALGVLGFYHILLTLTHRLWKVVKHGPASP